MRNSVYHYNSETCQYEPVPLNIKGIIGFVLSTVVFGVIMFTVMLFVYDRFTQSDLERNLRRENMALDKYYSILTSQLADAETGLTRLKEKDQNLYLKLFEETASTNAKSVGHDNSILLADASDFHSIFNSINTESTLLNSAAKNSNEIFKEKLKISKKDLLVLNSIPTLQPIANPDLDLLVSGYGVRINPFHKGKYKHPGIDFAAARGTEVYATAVGKVADIHISNLQAGYGNSIDIDHGHGFKTRYAHLEDIHIKVGQQVTKGMLIGTVGNSGGSIAPHLHYEVLLAGETVDPMTYMIQGLNSVDYSKLVSLSKKQNQSLD